MTEAISITEADVRIVMRDWLDQSGDKCSNLEDLDGCVEWFFQSLKNLDKVSTKIRS